MINFHTGRAMHMLRIGLYLLMLMSPLRAEASMSAYQPTAAPTMQMRSTSQMLVHSYGGGSSASASGGCSYGGNRGIGPTAQSGSMVSAPSLSFRHRNMVNRQAGETLMADERLTTGPRRVIIDDDKDDETGGWGDPYPTPIGELPAALIVLLAIAYSLRKQRISTES